LADHVFSAARLRAYRVLEDAGLGQSLDLIVLNLEAAAHLWLPLSLIEIAFRNATDRVLCASHPDQARWLATAGAQENGLYVAKLVEGQPFVQRAVDGGAVDDPVATSARLAAQQLGRDIISRDDLIAHLTFGFWSVRVPEGLSSTSQPIDTFELVSEDLARPLGMATGIELRERIVQDVLPYRNRVAHHEPLLFRAKHVFDRKTGEPKNGLALVDSLLGALDKFDRGALRILEIATVLAPMASAHIAPLREELGADLGPFRDHLVETRDRLREERNLRRAAQRQ
jgi:hypothetical protein